MESVDVVVVGCGIAGGAVATALARAGASVVVLERQVEYADHVRGEVMWQWGVHDARSIGVEDVLLEAGAIVVERLDVYDEGDDARTPIPLHESVPYVRGSLNIAHPAACAALGQSAETAGAHVFRGVRDVRISTGETPTAAWLVGGRRAEVRTRLVVGADGRRSLVRTQARMELEVDPPAHWIAGMLVSDLDPSVAEINLIGREDDLLFLSFPQREDRARFYLCFPLGDRGRFTGAGAEARFIEACRMRCIPVGDSWRGVTPTGPCATFPGDDSRVRVPYADGVLLVGDAAGYDNPLQGFGLSMAMRDAREVVGILLSSQSWADEAFSSYIESRARRQRWANVSNALEVWANDGFSVQDPTERAARYAQIRADEILSVHEHLSFTGFDDIPDNVSAEEIEARVKA